MKAVKSFRICNQPQIYTGISKIKIPRHFYYNSLSFLERMVWIKHCLAGRNKEETNNVFFRILFILSFVS